jgi:hypothetical protein
VLIGYREEASMHAWDLSGDLGSPALRFGRRSPRLQRLSTWNWLGVLLTGALSAASPAGAELIQPLVPPAATELAQAGSGTGISGDRVVLGAPASDDADISAGAAHVFVRIGASWVEEAQLLADDAVPFDALGTSVAMSADTVVAGAPGNGEDGAGAGASYVFVRSGSLWTQEAKLIRGGAYELDAFGSAVAINGDTILVGAPRNDEQGTLAGTAYAYLRSGSTWSQQAQLDSTQAAPLDEAGFSVSISGETAAVGAPGNGAGSVFVYVRVGSIWIEQAVLSPSGGGELDRFGAQVSLSGNTLVVGAPGSHEGDVRVGSTYVFVRIGSAWFEQARLLPIPPTPLGAFGSSLALTADTLVVGGEQDEIGEEIADSAYVFSREGTVWTQQAMLGRSSSSSWDGFGTSSIAISGGHVVAGAPLNDDAGANAGAAYLFSVSAWFPGDSWVLSGVAAGGTIDLTVNGVMLIVPTSPGESSSEVAANLAAAINADATLAGMGVAAASEQGELIVNGSVSEFVVQDPGLSVAAILPVVPFLPRSLLVVFAALMLCAGWAVLRWRASHQSLAHLLLAAQIGALGTGLALAGVLWPGPALADPYDELIEIATTYGAVNVIVEVATPFQPEGTLPNAAAITAQRAGIASAQDALLADLSPFSVSVNRSFFNSIPHIALRIDLDALNHLIATLGPLQMELDSIQDIHLLDTIPLVHADEALSGGYPAGGRAVVVLDTGVDKNHAMFTDSYAKVVHEACRSSNDPNRNRESLCPGGTDSEEGNDTGLPCPMTFSACEHGTHVAGIAAGYDLAPDQVIGVARDWDVIPIQVFRRYNDSADCPSGAPCIRTSHSDWISALTLVQNFAESNPRNNPVCMHGAGCFDVASVNMSFGGGEHDAECDAARLAADRAIENLRSIGILAAISSGNDGFDDAVGYPGCISDAITVGNTTKSDDVNSSSNSARFMDMLAPGTTVRSAVPTGYTCTQQPPGAYCEKTGTSMAAPHVAGAISLLRAAQPTWTVDEIERALIGSGRCRKDPKNDLSHPRLHVKRAVDFDIGTYWDSHEDIEGDGPHALDYPALIGTVDANTTSDVILLLKRPGGLEIRTKLSNGDGTWTGVNQLLGDGPGVFRYPAIAGDINADSLTDVILILKTSAGLEIRSKISTGTGLWTSASDTPGDGYHVHDYPTLPGDYDGNGMTDLVFLLKTDQGLKIRTKFSNGDGTWTGTEETLGDGPGVFKFPRLVGDVDGDGDTDLIFLLESEEGLRIRTKFSNGDGTWTGFEETPGDGPGVFEFPRLTGDVDGDGDTDLIFLLESDQGLKIRTKLSNGDGTWSGHEDIQGDGPGVFRFPAMTGDVDGDGDTDLIIRGNNFNGCGLNIRVKLSNGDGTWTATRQVVGDGPGVNKVAPVVGYVDLDNRSDVVFLLHRTSQGLALRAKLSTH